jgi:phosphatidylinositol 4-kinase type 2
MTKLQFDDIVESVRTAIELGVHPKLITQGSSGSYFARNAQGKVVGVFKPKDEEPYASRIATCSHSFSAAPASFPT